MAIPNILQTGISGLTAAKTQMGTTSHNIANANTEGYSRQRVQQTTDNPQPHGKHWIGSGTTIARNERVNDSYVEKQVRNAGRELAHFEEKSSALKQTEDVFNEMSGEGLNRLMANFFNDFRKLANDPDSEAVRQSVVESAKAMTKDFQRVYNQLGDVRSHLDSRIEGYARDINSTAEHIKDLNLKIKALELAGGSANDLRDQRDLALKKLGEFLDISVVPDNDNGLNVDIRGVGPLISGSTVEKFIVNRTQADAQGKPENALSISYTGSASADLTHAVQGGKFGALLEVRDDTIGKMLQRMDDLALRITESVNDVHRTGINKMGETGILLFDPILNKKGASENIRLSSAIMEDPNKIAAALSTDAPGDNRTALAIAQIQNERLMSEGASTVDDFYNSIVADVGILSARSQSNYNQQRDISLQLNKIRDRISGVSIDEETANLMQYQNAFGASAKVIQVADEMLKTVLDLKR